MSRAEHRSEETEELLDPRAPTGDHIHYTELDQWGQDVESFIECPDLARALLRKADGHITVAHNPAECPGWPQSIGGEQR